MTNTRNLIKSSSAAGTLRTLPASVWAGNGRSQDKIWACLLHLSFNFAAGILNPKWGNGPREAFEPEESIWNDAISSMADQGINMLVINLDDSVVWDSHPEISLRNSWTPQRLHEELEKIRSFKMEPIPMLNFSSTHDAWLGKYSRMLSTRKYYDVCRDLMAEAIDIFNKPRFFHLGMDEETFSHQEHFDYIVLRQDDLWWGDLYFYMGEVMKKGVRPWVWSDYVWRHPEKFFKMMPRSVVQSNCYYGENFDMKNMDASHQTYVGAYIDLEREGYDQIPTGSNDQNNSKSIGNTVDFCSRHIADNRLLGFLQTFWMPTIEAFRNPILQGIDLIGEARKSHLQNH
jgi:hypothetical protein